VITRFLVNLASDAGRSTRLLFIAVIVVALAVLLVRILDRDDG